MASPEMVEELAKLDRLEQDMIAARSMLFKDKPTEEILDDVRNETHEQFMAIVNKYQDAPVFRVKQPAPHAGTP